jgi:hypothetical protein
LNNEALLKVDLSSAKMVFHNFHSRPIKGNLIGMEHTQNGILEVIVIFQSPYSESDRLKLRVSERPPVEAAVDIPSPTGQD